MAKTPSAKAASSRPASSRPSESLKLGRFVLTTSVDVPLRIALLLWGSSGTGKTTYAATMPGKKLIISLEPDGRNAIAHRDDCYFLDIDGLGLTELFNELQADDPLSLDSFLTAHPEVESVVFDSATALAFRALQKAVREGYGRSSNFTPTMEAPGLAAYGARNGIVLTCLTGLLKVTSKHNRHICIITHEDDPKTDPKTNVTISIGMVLGGKLVGGFSWRLSEIWHLSQHAAGARARYISVRPHALRSPMKTRMFREGNSAQFQLKYNADKPDAGQPDTLAAIYHRWLEAGGAKIPIPGGDKD